MIVRFPGWRVPGAIGLVVLIALSLYLWKWPLLPDSAGSRVCVARGDGSSQAHGRSGNQKFDAADAAFDFLDAQMDLYHGSMIIYSEPGFGAYYPSGRIGDIEDITADADYRGSSFSGRASLRIDYKPRPSGGMGWAGIYFQYPDGNWGRLPGRNLSGATKLTFWACADRDTYAEFSIGGLRDSSLPHSDSFSKRSTGRVALNTTWQRYEIDLKGADLSSVIGAFAVATSREKDSKSRSIFLDDIAIDLPRLNEPRFLQSYVPSDCPADGMPSSAQTYDQALSLLAFLARGKPDDLRRAELIARALVEAQSKDRTFRDGRLRNAYASGDLADPHAGSMRLPGEYNREAQRYFEDENAAGSDTGNMAWAALALVQAHAGPLKSKGDAFLGAALSLARWIVANTRMDDGFGGFSGGFHGFERGAGIAEGQSRKPFRSTEHNIDLEALFDHLASVTGRDSVEGRYWDAQRAHAQSFVAKMRNGDAAAPFFWTGTKDETVINKDVVPLDAQTWAVLHTREPATYAQTLDWALKNCTERGSRDAFDFNCNDGDGAWWEGTAQVAASLRWLKRDAEALPIIDRLKAAQLKDGAAIGAMPAASRCGLTTGFNMSFASGKTVPWLYPKSPHVGATAWFIFAVLGVNPYFVAGR